MIPHSQYSINAIQMVFFTSFYRYSTSLFKEEIYLFVFRKKSSLNKKKDVFYYLVTLINFILSDLFRFHIKYGGTQSTFR